MCFHPIYRNVLEGQRGLTDYCRFLQTIGKLFLESFLQLSRTHFFKMQSTASRYIFYLLLCLFSLLVVKQNMCVCPFYPDQNMVWDVIASVYEFLSQVASVRLP